MRVRTCVAAALLCVALPGVGEAQNRPVGFYIGIGAGPNFSEDSDITRSGINTTAELNTGYAILGALGYGFDMGLRAEVEFGYRENTVDSLRGAANGRGDYRSYALMANLLYDINTGTSVTPYLGAGIGVSYVRLDHVGPLGTGFANDSEGVFAYQGIVGATMPIVEQLYGFAEYRYFATEDVAPARTVPGGVDADYANHTILLGLRWAFAGPPKPPAPPPAPAPAVAPPPPAPPPAARPVVPREYVVFFDFNKSDLTPQALEIIRTAATNAKAGNAVRLAVTGHADRSGADRYNQALSERRAKAVAAELQRQGINQREIDIAWKGESEPLVPTADGVREPQNRRVHIVFR
jgi:OmpA-OmpF porin, OOP family